MFAKCFTFSQSPCNPIRQDFSLHFLAKDTEASASLIIFFKPHCKQLGRLDLNAGQFHTNDRLLLTAVKEPREKKWRTRSGRGQGDMPACQEMFQMPLLLPYLKSARRQEQEPEQTLFSGKDQLGLALVCVRAELELWISVVLQTQWLHLLPSAGSPNCSSR